MFILHIALGGCLKEPPVSYGITADTGGHIAYILDAAAAQARHPLASHISIVTRQFDDPGLGPAYVVPRRVIEANLSIDRLTTANRRYLAKAEIAGDLAALVRSFCAHLASLPALPDVIHAHFADAAMLAAMAKRRFDIPFVYTPHALGLDKHAHGVAEADAGSRVAMERQALCEADAVVVSTRDEAERQVGAYGQPVAGKVFCLPPGVPSRPSGGGALTASLGDWLIRPELPIVLAIARPVIKKNLAALARAFAADAALRGAANLIVLAGQHANIRSAEERAVVKELVQLSRTPALRGHMALPPAHDAADVMGLYHRAAAGGVFVNPALHEPFGLTLIEAAAAGVPVVATRNGGSTEILAQIGHGILVDPRSEAEIAAACRRLISDRRLHADLRASALKHVGFYDWDRYAKQSFDCYATLRRFRNAA